MPHCHPEIARQIPCDEASDPDRPGPLRSSFGAQGPSPTAPGIRISRCAGAGSSPIASAVPIAPCSAAALSAGEARDLDRPGLLRASFGAQGPGPSTPDISSSWRGDFLSTTEVLTTGKKLAVSDATPGGILATDVAAESPSQMACDQHGCSGPGTGTGSERCSCCSGCTFDSDKDVCFVCFDSPPCNLDVTCPVCCLTPFSQYTWTAPSTGCRRSAG